MNQDWWQENPAGLDQQLKELRAEYRREEDLRLDLEDQRRHFKHKAELYEPLDRNLRKDAIYFVPILVVVFAMRNDIAVRITFVMVWALLEIGILVAATHCRRTAQQARKDQVRIYYQISDLVAQHALTKQLIDELEKEKRQASRDQSGLSDAVRKQLSR